MPRDAMVRIILKTSIFMLLVYSAEKISKEM
jgi:hypothetical protein